MTDASRGCSARLTELRPPGANHHISINDVISWVKSQWAGLQPSFSLMTQGLEPTDSPEIFPDGTCGENAVSGSLFGSSRRSEFTQ